MSLRNFPATSLQHFGRSATFQSRPELGVMTLDRDRLKHPVKASVPTASQATLESRCMIW